MSVSILTLNDQVDTGVVPGIASFEDGDTTPNVAGRPKFETANSGATTITDFDNGWAGQEITIIAGDVNTTIQCNGTNIKLQGGNEDFGPMAVDDTITLVYNSSDIWVEKCRMVNS